jgi:CSLREA domain-containing protein
MDRWGTLALGLVLVGGIGVGAAPVTAATFSVDTTADAADPNPGDGTCGSGPGGCSLRAAIQECNRSTVSNSISLPAGTYRLTITGPNESLAATGDLDLVTTTSISGAGRESTVIDGGGIDRVLEVSQHAIVEIEDLTIRGGAVDGGDGGGILNDGRLKLEDVTVSGGRAKADPLSQNGRGGGLASHTHLSLMNVRVSGNTSDGDGGGIENSGFLEVMSSTIDGNASLTQDGGGISNRGKLTLAISTVEGNRGTKGGGLDNVEGEARVIDSTFARNTSAAAGAGIWNSGPLVVVNSTISGNTAGGAGGGIANEAAGTVDLNNVTLSGNLAGAAGGGGIAAAKAGSVTLGNTIVAGNRASGGSAADCAATVVSRGYNLVESAAGCTLTGNALGDQTGKDPKLAALAGNGGPTKTHSLTTGSPAIDAGNPAPPTGEGGACAGADQRGVKRPQNATGAAEAICDIGAFELEPAEKTSSGEAEKAGPGGRG